MQRIMVAGDTGDVLSHWKSLLEVAAEHDCTDLYQLGDTGYSERDEYGRNYLAGLSEAAGSARIPISFIDGNHEDHKGLWTTYQNAPRSPEGFWELRPGVRYIPRGHAWDVEGVRFMGLGGAYSVDKDQRLRLERERNEPGSLWSPLEELTDDQVAAAKRQGGRVAVMLTHDKPRATNPSREFSAKQVDAGLANQDRVTEVMRAVRPSLLLHGHLHFPYEVDVPVGDDYYERCRVVSLDAEESGSRGPKPYDLRNSWVILEVHNGSFELTHLPPALLG